MKKSIALSLLFFNTVTSANDFAVNAFIDSIKSADQVKASIRDSILEECGSGHCWNINASRICDLVAGLDVKVGYAITGNFENEKASIQISNIDLKLMKLIFSQCKPSNYQFWSFGRILHVVYDPSPKIAAEVNKRLGIKKN